MAKQIKKWQALWPALQKNTGSCVIFHECVFLFFFHSVECGVPDPPQNGSINYTRTTEGAVLTFVCDEFFFPVAVEVAICSQEGVWRPAPYEHNCTLDGQLATIELLYNYFMINYDLLFFFYKGRLTFPANVNRAVLLASLLPVLCISHLLLIVLFASFYKKMKGRKGVYGTRLQGGGRKKGKVNNDESVSITGKSNPSLLYPTSLHEGSEVNYNESVSKIGESASISLSTASLQDRSKVNYDKSVGVPGPSSISTLSLQERKDEVNYDENVPRIGESNPSLLSTTRLQQRRDEVNYDENLSNRGESDPSLLSATRLQERGRKSGKSEARKVDSEISIVTM